MQRECYRLRAKLRLCTVKVASKVLKICSFVPGFIDIVTEKREKKKKKVTWYLGYSLHWSPYVIFMLVDIVFTPPQQCLGQYHIRQRPDTVHWLKFICIPQRSAASAQCFASRAPLPKEVLGSGNHEHRLKSPQLPPAITATAAVTESRCCKYFRNKAKSI